MCRLKLASNGILFCSLFVITTHAGESTEVEVDEDGTINADWASQFGYESGPTTITRSSIQPKPWTILKELFPDTAESLSHIWGERPAYLPASKSNNANGNDSDSDDYSTLLEIPPSSNKSPNRFTNLFKIDDSLAVLQNHPDLVHGTDYLVLKYLVRDGEEWSGKLPYQSIPAQSISRLLHEKAFSLVINNLHNHWTTVRDFARSLELETSAPEVSCNLYLTPPGAARAFETHADWMDVLVLQIEGEKRWSVGRWPVVRLMPPDRKRKPTVEDLGASSFDGVTLRQGDALYIPRGYLHNATNMVDGGGKMSLHLTFGVEYGFKATMEALVHHAVEMFGRERGAGGGGDDLRKEAAVPPHLCQGHTLTWVKLLHYSISELARLTDCGGFGERGGKKRGDENEAICSLRESVPLHPQLQELSQRSDRAVETKYRKALEAILHEVDSTDALNFMNSLGLSTQPETLGLVDFKYIGIDKHEPFSCKLPKKDILDSGQDTLASVAEYFYDFAIEKFHDVRQRLIDHVEDARISRWKMSERRDNRPG